MNGSFICHLAKAMVPVIQGNAKLGVAVKVLIDVINIPNQWLCVKIILNNLVLSQSVEKR